MRTTHFALPLSLALSLSGCATGPHVVPTGGVPQVVSAAGGVSLVVSDEEWDGDPGDLNEYVTALPIELTNTGTTEVRVSYFDFALVDESGARYKALNPFQQIISDAGSEAGKPSADAVATLYPEEIEGPTVLLAARSVHVAPPRMGPSMMAPRMRSPGGTWSRPPVYGARPHYNSYGGYSSRRPWLGWRTGYQYGGWRGYHVFPGYRPWFGAGFGYYWNDPFFWPPGYSSWVIGWGGLGYPGAPYTRPPARPSQDVLNMALPEGVLSPGGHVAGFLYFQRARPGTKHLVLTWDMAEARQGTQLGQAQVMLDVVE